MNSDKMVPVSLLFKKQNLVSTLDEFIGILICAEDLEMNEAKTYIRKA
jgi:hypothetical protein